ncbi:MAG: serpin family protein [Bacteroidales bacterium]|nr:serpin family protein [Bacteroidales bacterium]
MKRNKILTVIWLLVFVTMGSMATSCHSNVEKPIVEEEVMPPCKIILTEHQRAFVSGSNAFAFCFLETVNSENTDGKSFVFSPLSIAYALSMVNDAAEGLTRKELQNTLGLGDAETADINMFYKILIDSMPMVDPKVRFHIANAIFLNQDYTLKKQFRHDMQNYYDAQAEALDFTSPKSLGIINSWCNNHTNGMIPRIIECIDDPFAVSYLLNAIYFKADWEYPFEESLTEADTFTTANGPIMLPLMWNDEKYRYMNNDIFSAVDIPYGNGEWSMTVMLPEEGRSVDDVVDYLAKDGLSLLSESRYRPVYLKLPRFETESETSDLIGTMKKMGILRAFDNASSEIPNMCNANVYISMMLQKAHIKVDEKGSEAAAVTIVKTEPTSSHIEQPVTFHANRPFVYVIREASSGVVFFVGKFTGR